jgi:hypothetical protein
MMFDEASYKKVAELGVFLERTEFAPLQLNDSVLVILEEGGRAWQ